jgi:hypothetical protein
VRFALIVFYITFCFLVIGICNQVAVLIYEPICLNRPQFAGGSKVSIDGAYGKK